MTRYNTVPLRRELAEYFNNTTKVGVNYLNMKFACCDETTVITEKHFLICKECNKKYHLKCLFPNKIGKDSYSAFKLCWLCPTCSSIRPREARNDNTPVRTTTPTIIHSPTSDAPHPSSAGDTATARPARINTAKPAPPSPTATVTLEQIKLIISEEMASVRQETLNIKNLITKELNTFKEELNTIKDSLQFIDSKYSDIDKKVNKLESQFKTLSSLSSEFTGLQLKIKHRDTEDNKREQWLRRSNVEIYGIPEKKSENLMNVIQKIADKKSFPLQVLTDIDFATRVAPKSRDDNKIKPVVIRFFARHKKDEFLSYIKQNSPILPKDLGFDGSTAPIRFRDHLTSLNKALLREVKKLSADYNYKYVWVKNCTIMARRTDTSPVIHIINEGDLKKITK